MYKKIPKSEHKKTGPLPEARDQKCCNDFDPVWCYESEPNRRRIAYIKCCNCGEKFVTKELYDVTLEERNIFHIIAAKYWRLLKHESMRQGNRDVYFALLHYKGRRSYNLKRAKKDVVVAMQKIKAWDRKRRLKKNKK